MNRPNLLPTSIPPARSRVNRFALRRGSFLITLALVCFGLSDAIRAVTPAPDGGYANDNTAEGTKALFSLTTGLSNTANGAFALQFNTTGDGNTATGVLALENNTSGCCNTADGINTLVFNTTGNGNKATGYLALYSNATGTLNTATGASTLEFNRTGDNNTATGQSALSSNTTGSGNTANGAIALFTNTIGDDNTATGMFALFSNTSAPNNTATGFEALFSNTTGSANTANGFGALFSNTTGSFNTASGFNALQNNTNGSNNIALGSNAGANLTTGSNNIDIGALGVPGESNTIRIGTVGVQKSAYMRGISGATVASGVGVIVDTKGHLGTVTSSARFKEAIKPMDKSSEAILALKPVTFRYKHELDPDGIPQFGLIAEQVEKVNPDLVVRDAEGKVNTVRYEAVNAMLLNEFLKEHRRAEEQRKYFEAKFVQQQKQIEALTATVQKVSDRLELSKPAPQIVADNQ